MGHRKTCKTCMYCDPYIRTGNKTKCYAIQLRFSYPMVNTNKDRSRCHHYKKRYDVI